MLRQMCAHASSSENRASNAGRDMGLAVFHLAGTGQYRNVAGRQAATHHIMCRRTEGDKPLAKLWLHLGAVA